jgi:hypothetical protein
MAATEDLSTKSQETEPVRALFDLLSFWATIWGFVAFCFWAEMQVLRAFDTPSSLGMVLLLVSTPAIFLLTMWQVQKHARIRALVEHVRYVVILAAAVLLGAYMHSAHKDQSYESHLREGAFLAIRQHTVAARSMSHRCLETSQSPSQLP